MSYIYNDLKDEHIFGSGEPRFKVGDLVRIESREKIKMFYRGYSNLNLSDFNEYWEPIADVQQYLLDQYIQGESSRVRQIIIPGQTPVKAVIIVSRFISEYSIFKDSIMKIIGIQKPSESYAEYKCQIINQSDDTFYIADFEALKEKPNDYKTPEAQSKCGITFFDFELAPYISPQELKNKKFTLKKLKEVLNDEYTGEELL